MDATTGKLTVLVVEDDPETLQMLQDVLALDGLDAVGVGSPEQAESVARSILPDAVVIDIMLPGQSGIELAAQLRYMGCTDTPMIAITASLLMADMAAEAGLFQAELQKPLDVDELLACVLECTHRPSPASSSVSPLASATGIPTVASG